MQVRNALRHIKCYGISHLDKQELLFLTCNVEHLEGLLCYIFFNYNIYL